MTTSGAIWVQWNSFNGQIVIRICRGTITIVQKQTCMLDTVVVVLKCVATGTIRGATKLQIRHTFVKLTDHLKHSIPSSASHFYRLSWACSAGWAGTHTVVCVCEEGSRVPTWTGSGQGQERETNRMNSPICPDYSS